jgi:S1-C subfamily serine protease
MQEGSGYNPYGYGNDADFPGYGAGHGSDGSRRRRRIGASVLTHLAVALLAAGAATGVTLSLDPAASNTGSTSNTGAPLPGAAAVPSPTPSPSGNAAGGSVQQVVNTVESGLVIINTTQRYNSEVGAGTGMVINSDGLVLTNNHVIAEATKITATAVATGKTYPAAVVGYDKTGDIALIQLQGASGLHPIPVGNSAAVKTRAAVVALGNAEGQGTIIPAAGQVTAVNQTITASDQGGTASTETLHGMIQISAHIVPGDSGGPLATASGQVIGMDTAGNSVSLTSQQAAGFAIPINTALAVARQIAAGHSSQVIAIGYPPFLGILTGAGTSADPQVQAQQQEQSSGFGNGFGGFGGFNGFGLPTPASACYTSNTSVSVPSSVAPASSGTLIDGTICGSPAATAGITSGSVITSVGGQPAGSPEHLSSILARYRPGDAISLTWINPAGQRTTSTIRLADGPPQ